MATAKKKRLFKIASEINIGKDTIVNFLNTKGFEIANKPTTTLTPEMVEMVYDKFKREKRAAEVRREKIQKHKDLRREAHEEHRKEKEKEEPAEKEAPKKAAPKEKSAEVPEAVEEKAAEEKEEAVPEAKEAEKEEQKEEPVKEEVPQEEEKTEEQKEKKAKEKPAKKEKAAEKIKEEPEEAPQKEAEKEKPVKKEKAAEKKEEPEKAPEKEVEKEEKAAKAKKRKKPKKLVEIDPDADEGNGSKGLKIVGKIDISGEKRRRQKSKKGKSAEEEGEEKTKRSRKRKRGGKKEEPAAKSTPPKKEDKKKRKRKKSIREQISQEDVDKAIKETLAGMGSGGGGSSRAKMRQKKRAEREEKELRKSEEKEKEKTTLELTEFVTTGDLANLMNINPNDVILKCMELGLMVTINQRLDKDTITLIADDYGFSVEFVDEKSYELIEDEEDAEEELKPRSPIVTIMGHVDHGKTSLLDYIRHANVVAGEAGGITQHIAAYRVQMPNHRHITFLDTPGHEAFTAMRARGAQVTDIVVLVIAADDSVMPQTLEAISHAQAAKVPMVIAINKIDKPDANPDRIRQQLADQKILVEEWGGSFQSVEISAKKGLNVDQLMEKILLEAELLELQANPERKARGTVIESNMRKGLGAVATVIVQKGTLKIGEPFVSGVYAGRVRAMLDERGNKVEEAGPSIPVGVIGFDGLPEAGDPFTVVDDDTEARNIANERQQLRREQDLRQVRQITLDDISAQIQIGGVQDLHLIIKADVMGSLEAISDSMAKLSREEVRVSIIHRGVGSVKESDVMLAAASGAVIIGFNVSVTAPARKTAETEGVDIRQYDIIYDAINDIQLALEGLLKPEYKEEVTSEVEVRKVFKISRLGSIAGSYVKSGKINRNDNVRVLRDGLEVFDGGINSLKRGKDDVKEVDQGFECGIQLEGFNDVHEGDIIQGYRTVEVKRTFK